MTTTPGVEPVVEAVASCVSRQLENTRHGRLLSATCLQGA
jgi:hypothetical protein